MNKYNFTIVLGFALVCSGSVSREPHCSCSKFYYEEQLLEKTVRLGVRFEQLEKSIQQIQAALRIVAFNSKTVADTTLAKNQLIVFTEVVSNHGSGYDPSTGMFTAPVSGSYLFTAHLCPKEQRNIFYSIVVDGTEIVNGRDYDNSRYVCGTVSAIVVLQPLQNVWVKSRWDGDELSHDSHRWNMFSGVLLHGEV